MNREKNEHKTSFWFCCDLVAITRTAPTFFECRLLYNHINSVLKKEYWEFKMCTQTRARCVRRNLSVHRFLWEGCVGVMIIGRTLSICSRIHWMPPGEPAKVDRSWSSPKNVASTRCFEIPPPLNIADRVKFSYLPIKHAYAWNTSANTMGQALSIHYYSKIPCGPFIDPLQLHVHACILKKNSSSGLTTRSTRRVHFPTHS